MQKLSANTFQLLAHQGFQVTLEQFVLLLEIAVKPERSNTCRISLSVIIAVGS